MSLRLVANGTLGDIEIASQYEYGIDEGTQVELRVHFSYRFPLFNQAADALDASLGRSGVPCWQGAQRLVYVDPDTPLWSIRYTKGLAWLSVVIAGALLALAIAAFIAIWELFIWVGKTAIQALPGILIVGAAILGAVVVARQISKRV